MSCTLLMVLASLIPIRFPRFFCSQNCLYFLFFVFIACISILKILTNFFQLFIFSWHSLRYLSVSYIFYIFSLISLRDNFHFIFKNLYHLNRGGSKVVFLCFSCLSLFRYCCHRIVGPSWCHMAPSVVDGILTLAFRHLAFGWLYALIYIPKFVFIWWVLCSSLFPLWSPDISG